MTEKEKLNEIAESVIGAAIQVSIVPWVRGFWSPHTRPAWLLSLWSAASRWSGRSRFPLFTGT